MDITDLFSIGEEVKIMLSSLNIYPGTSCGANKHFISLPLLPAKPKSIKLAQGSIIRCLSRYTAA